MTAKRYLDACLTTAVLFLILAGVFAFAAAIVLPLILLGWYGVPIAVAFLFFFIATVIYYDGGISVRG